MSDKSSQETDEAGLSRIAGLSRERPVWVRIGRLIDGVSDLAVTHADLIFDARQIRFVGSNPAMAQTAAGLNEPDLELTDWTVLPCLIEAHAHLFLDGATVDLQQREAYLKNSPLMMLARGQARWPKILQCGIATVRDAGDKHGVGLALAAVAKKYRDQLASSPWIDSPGAAIHHRGRYGSFMGEPIEDHAGLAEVVEDRIAKGADRIKLLVSGIINFKVGKVTVPPQMTTEEVASLVVAAKRNGRQTFAHASGTEGVENSIEGGVTTVEHGFFVTENQLARMRDRRIGWVPTFAPVQAQIDYAKEMGWTDEIVGYLKALIEGHQKMLVRGHEMGVPIIAGSDAGSCGVPHGIGFLDELAHMERAGMPTMAILKSATGLSQEILQFAEPVGRIAAASRSRFIFTRHDVLKSVNELRKDKIILFDGAAIDVPEQIDAEGL